MEWPKRKPNRIPGYDYNTPSAYFITICTHSRLPILGAPSPTNAVIPHFVSTLKRFCNRDTGMQVFQRSYHDHVIRNEDDYLKIWQYIDNNPARWQEDCFYIPPLQEINQ